MSTSSESPKLYRCVAIVYDDESEQSLSRVTGFVDRATTERLLECPDVILAPGGILTWSREALTTQAPEPV